jgi:uncharacterized membrane protein
VIKKSGMTSETTYIILFIATFPALWLLAYLMDRFLPDQTKPYSPSAERERLLLLSQDKGANE